MNSACKPGNGSAEPEGTRTSAVRLNPEICIVVVSRKVLSKIEIKADAMRTAEGGSPANDMVSWQDTNGI